MWYCADIVYEKDLILNDTKFICPLYMLKEMM